MGAVWGDYDNDGYEDLLLYRWGRPELFHNDAGKGFTRVTETRGPARLGQRQHRRLARLRPRRPARPLPRRLLPRATSNLWKLDDTKMMPESFEYAKNGGRKYLYRNLGGGRFEEVSEQVGLVSRRWTLAAVAADLRGTRLSRPLHRQRLRRLGAVRERGRAGSARWARETGVGYAPKSGMNASVGDVLNQGRFAIYVSNISEEGILLQGNNLWVPTGAGERAAEVREPGHRHGGRPRRLELRRAVRRPQQRRLPRPLPGQRLRLAPRRRRATGTTTRRSRAATRS